jgi:hypothetical protein
MFHAYRESDVWSVEHSDDRNNAERLSTDTNRASVLKSFFELNEAL